MRPTIVKLPQLLSEGLGGLAQLVHDHIEDLGGIDEDQSKFPDLIDGYKSDELMSFSCPFISRPKMAKLLQRSITGVSWFFTLTHP